MSDSLETNLTKQSYGYMTKEDFAKKSQELAMQEKLKILPMPKISSSVPKPISKSSPIRRKPTPKLSFDVDEDEEDEGEGEGEGDSDEDSSALKRKRQQEDEIQSKKRKSMKNPGVNTSFLRKNEEEFKEEEARLIQERKKVIEAEEQIKSQPLEFGFNFMIKVQGPIPSAAQQYGRMAKITKGMTVNEFLASERTLFLKDVTSENQNTVSPNLMLIGWNFIIPNHYTFKELLEFKYTDGATQIFPFESSKERGSIDIIVTERSWFEKHRYIFPLSKWEPFDYLEKYSASSRIRLVTDDKTSAQSSIKRVFTS